MAERSQRAFEEAILKALAAIEARLSALEACLPAIEARLSAIEVRLPAIEARLPAIETQEERKAPVVGFQPNRSLAPMQKSL